MSKDKFVLLNLDDDELGEVSNVLSNKSSKKILDYLTNKDFATASDISKELDIALSTTHYNLKKLEEAKLITTNEYHYSEKGREVTHYKLANKYIIIAPGKKRSFLGELKKLLPAFVILGFLSFTIYILENFNSTQDSEAMPMAAESRDLISEDITLFTSLETTLITLAVGLTTLISLALWNKYKK